MSKAYAMIAAGAAALLALSGCSSAGGDAGSSGSAAPSYAVASSVTPHDSPTLKRAEGRGQLIVGVKEDQPGFGYLDVVTGERSGFDVEIARWTAATLGFGGDKITYKAVPSVAREQALANGDVDIYVGSYSITDKRKQAVDFAGPYFKTGQGILVQKSNDKLKAKEDFQPGVNVCSITGGTPIQNIRANFPGVKTTEFDTYSQCVESLKAGQVDAVTADEAQLLGFASQDPDALKVVGKTFSTELYGVGLPKGDTSLRKAINTMFTDGQSTWSAIFQATLGSTGKAGEQPAVDNY
ncbi:glutamate ABC transporter substrate-binding protein [Arthrobacter nitrophenolicus]|uniref:Glutamate ABC transporter substrate-binding protein n=1 Tax=Arthrobacter nitrophenolicus TaxID=683150 RepID=A0A4R5Y507_9MICC|nr:glutamate ABC transporter substrate-binding protein [Arthrobacter nitrophenolicus]TDL39641.1 glutamate ABC transporter substrate-binding protein [Arthrobacter nitrophenolicus]